MIPVRHRWNSWMMARLTQDETLSVRCGSFQPGRT